jgi:hypothetical protein
MRWGDALVFIFFPKSGEEKRLLEAYHAQDAAHSE